MRKKHRVSGDRGASKPYVPSIALRSISGHLTRTRATVTAWYRLPPQRWSFRTDSERWGLIEAIAGQYADLQGRWLHLRVTSRPYPVPMWAHAHVRTTHNAPRDVSGALSFDEYMLGEQRQLQGRAMADREVYLGVEISRRSLLDSAIDTARPLLERVAPKLLDAEVQALDAEIRHVDTVVAAPGLQARPVTSDEMAWLVHRSTNVGLPAPGTHPTVGTGQWSSEDLASFTEGSTADQEPYAPTVTVRGRAGELAGLERHVAVLTLGLFQKLRIPEHDSPWMQRADALGIPLEWSARIYIRRPEEVQGELQRQMSKVRSQVKHYTEEHELEPPQDLASQSERASDIEAEISGQMGSQHTRVKGWWRVAVAGATRQEALDHAQRLLQLYKPKIAIEHPESQYHLRREFIPGEPLSSQAHMRRGSVTFAASAVPAATASVGDRRGILLGETTGTARHPVAWDPWMSQEVRGQSGLTAMVAGLGGGKSFLGGGIVYKTLRAGAHWTVLDPSGPLAQLCELPELRPYARVINLLNAHPGILNPYRVVPDPRSEHVGDDRAWRRALTDAAATRRRLCEDVLVGILPYELARESRTRIVLKRAVRAVGGASSCHPGMVIDELRRDQSEHREHAQAVYEFLDEMRDRLTLLIPEDGADPYAVDRDDRLTVLTLPGLTLPQPDVAREYWTDAEALGVELLSLAAWLTQRMIYSGPADYQATTGQQWKDVRKGVWIDEAFFLTRVPAGRVLMDRFARDSRKWNTRVLLSSQVPADFLQMDGIASLLDATFVGRLNDEDVQSDALRLLGVPVGAGYEGVLSSLASPQQAEGDDESDRSPRQFVFADGAGGIERIRVDFSGDHLAGLRQALETTPGASSQTDPPAIQAAADHSHRRNRDHGAEGREHEFGQHEVPDELGGAA